MKARFSGQVTLDASRGPEKFSLSGQGNGGAAGFAKGGADVTLSKKGNVTVLSYKAKAEIGGKLAQLGSRLIQGTAKKLATKFFKSFSEVVVEPSLDRASALRSTLPARSMARPSLRSASPAPGPCSRCEARGR